MRGNPVRFTLLALLLLCVASSAVGQSLNGTITGVVKDPTDAVIPAANVIAVDLATGREYRTATDASGSFTFTNLNNGYYRVTIEAQGFAKYVVARVQVLISQTSTVTAKMELAKTGSEIVVTSEQNVVDVDSAELKASITREQLINIPLPTRNPLDLVRTMPGIVTPTNSGIADSFVHGLRGNSTNLTQDGINMADNTVKTSAFFSITAPTVDAVGEFNVSVGGVGVDAGFGAAQVSIRTPRGTNDFHGSLYWYQRTNAFNANTWFNNASGTERPYQLQNRIGANAGGPVYIPGVYDGRNRTWVFGNYEAFREPLSRSRTRTVLSDSARTGMFTYRVTCTDTTMATTTTADDCPAGITPGQTRTVDLLTLGIIGNTGVMPTINATAMNYYNAFVPSPNTDAGCGSGDSVNIRCFRFNLPGKGIQDRYTLRADHQLSKNHTIEYAFNQAEFNSLPDLLNGIEPQFPNSIGGSQKSRRQLMTWALHSVFGTNMTNTVRGGFQRAPVEFAYFNDFSNTGGFQITTPGVLTDPNLTSGNLPQGRNTPVRQVIDDFSWVKGRHRFQFGGEYRVVLSGNFFFNTVVPRIQLGANTANPNGITSGDFAGGISSGDLTRSQTVFNMVTGLVSSVTQGFNHTSPSSGFVGGVPRNIDPIQHNVSGYFQDSFKWKPNFTITAGLRYEYQGVFDLRNGLVLKAQGGEQGLWGPSAVGSLFNPTTSPVQTDTLLDFGGGRNGDPIYEQDNNNFAPYLSFAWDPWKDGKTSIRGSGAVHFTQDGFTLFSVSATGNSGLFSVRSACNPAGPNCTTTGLSTGALNLSAVPTPAAPAAAFPVSQRSNFLAGAGTLWFFKEGLATPYVTEWSLSVSRELWKRVAVEVRYVGNHATKQFRSYSINEQNLLNSPYTCTIAACTGQSVANLLTEFLNAQINQSLCLGAGDANMNMINDCVDAQAAAGVGASSRTDESFGNWGLAGQVNLPIFTSLFGSATSGFFGNSAFTTPLSQNQIGSVVNTLRSSNTFLTNREANFPLNFFVANPYASNGILVDNSSSSYYHGLEMEVRRRFAGGLFFTANYTFSKVLGDVGFLTSQQEFQNYRSLLNRGLNKQRAAFDITHSMSANFIYPLPFGKGKWLGGNASGVLDKLIGGWSVNGLTRIASGAPFTITSGRNTTGAVVGSFARLRNMTLSELQSHIGVFQGPDGVYWLDPNSGLLSVSGTTTRAVFCTSPTQTTPCFEHPGVLDEGNVSPASLDGPKFTNQDFSIIKRTGFPSVSESFNFEIRFEFFNLFNHANFGGLSTGIDSTSFGELSSIVDTVRGGGVTSRIIQWAIRVNW